MPTWWIITWQILQPNLLRFHNISPVLLFFFFNPGRVRAWWKSLLNWQKSFLQYFNFVSLPRTGFRWSRCSWHSFIIIKHLSRFEICFKVTLPETNIAPERDFFNWKYIFQPSIFRCYVSFRECKSCENWWQVVFLDKHQQYFMIFFKVLSDIKKHPSG